MSWNRSLGCRSTAYSWSNKLLGRKTKCNPRVNTVFLKVPRAHSGASYEPSLPLPNFSCRDSLPHLLLTLLPQLLSYASCVACSNFFLLFLRYHLQTLSGLWTLSLMFWLIFADSPPSPSKSQSYLSPSLSLTCPHLPSYSIRINFAWLSDRPWVWGSLQPQVSWRRGRCGRSCHSSKRGPCSSSTVPWYAGDWPRCSSRRRRIACLAKDIVGNSWSSCSAAGDNRIRRAIPRCSCNIPCMSSIYCPGPMMHLPTRHKCQSLPLGHLVRSLFTETAGRELLYFECISQHIDNCLLYRHP